MVEQRMQRRLAAVLVADVAGYTRLMSRDEAGTLERLKALRRTVIDPCIALHSGRIVKLMGDGTLIEFASVVDAVTCAIAIQEALADSSENAADDRRFVLRIGINLGDVMVDGDDLYGDGVNIAARLQEIAEPGGIYVSGTVLEHIGKRADIAFDDCGERQIKNIDRPLRVHRVRLGTSSSAPPAPPRAQDGPSERTASIAVLPFTNMSGDPDQDYFSDGITEDIIIELSRFRSLFVIARNSSFALKGIANDVREVGRRLGVRYVVEGSVRRAGNRIRVTAQLVDAAGGQHLWAERYDREIADIFAVQDEVAQQIVINVAPRLQFADQSSAKRRSPGDLRAYDLYLQAKPLVDMPRDLADLQRARTYCDRAIEIDPGYARAHAYRALSYVLGIPLGETDDLAEWHAQALASAERAVALDDLDNVCHWALGEASFWTLQPDRARHHIGKAIALNPNDADVLAIACYFEIGSGDVELGLRHKAMALERNPTNPAWYHWAIGSAMAMIGRYEEALAEYAQCDPPNIDVVKLRAIALAHLGRLDEARAQMRILLTRRPDLTIGKIRKQDLCMSDLEARIQGLRLAGLPE